MTVGDQLRQLRMDRGFSLGSLSDRSGIHKSTLSRWESGVQRPGIPELEAALSTLEASPEARLAVLELLRGTGAPRALRLIHDERRDAVERAQLSPVLQNGMPGGGSLLRALRMRRGWSQEQVATYFKRHLSLISRWEQGYAWPEPEQLRTLCLLLGATPQETESLLSGRLEEKIAPQDIEEVEHRFRTTLAPIDWMSELYPTLDLSFIAMESALWTHAMQRPSVRPLLGEVYAHHANYLRNAFRFAEGGSYAEKALSLAEGTRTPSRLSPDWVQLAVVCLADAAAKGGSYPRPGRGEDILRRGLSQHNVSVPYTSWIFRKISDYQSKQGRVADALESLHASQDLLKHTSQWGEGLWSVSANSVETQRYMASLLLKTGQVEEALQWLPTTTEAYPSNRLRDYRLWAKASLQMSRPSEAHTWIERAYTDIRIHGLSHRLPDFEPLAAQL